MALDEMSGRLVLMTMDLDRCENQLIPDLRQQVFDLTRALKRLLVASGDTSLANRAAGPGQRPASLTSTGAWTGPSSQLRAVMEIVTSAESRLAPS
jgi:hypothetical protein